MLVQGGLLVQIGEPQFPHNDLGGFQGAHTPGLSGAHRHAGGHGDDLPGHIQLKIVPDGTDQGFAAIEALAEVFFGVLLYFFGTDFFFDMHQEPSFQKIRDSGPASTGKGAAPFQVVKPQEGGRICTGAHMAEENFSAGLAVGVGFMVAQGNVKIIGQGIQLSLIHI